jgi:hypothetical protein
MRFIIVAICITVFLAGVFPVPAGADEINTLKQQIKECNNEACKQALKNEAGQIFDAVGKEFDDDFTGLGNDICVNFSRSIFSEIVYHLDRIKPYYNFADVFELERLKKLQENKISYDRKAIGIKEFNRMKTQIQTQYQQDMKESQDFIDFKVARLKVLCRQFHDNLNAIRIRMAGKGNDIPELVKQQILELKDDQVWQEFEGARGQGKKFYQALMLASGNAGTEVLNCMHNMFPAAVHPKGTDKVFSGDLVDRIQKSIGN